MGIRAGQKSKVSPEQIALEKRIDYVLSCAIRPDLRMPFMETTWDGYVLEYLKSGDERRKLWFPLPKPGNLDRLIEREGGGEVGKKRIESLRQRCIKELLGGK